MIGGRAFAASSRSDGDGMPEPQLGDLGELRREASRSSCADRLELLLGGLGGAFRFASSAFASRLASARVAATTACSSRRSAVSPAPGEREQVGDRLGRFA